MVYKLSGDVQSFNDVTVTTPFKLPDSKGELYYLDEQPFFKVNIVEFEEDPAKPVEWPRPNSFNIDQYNTELLALKSLSNDTSFVQYLSQYIHDYMGLSRSQIFHEHSNYCDHQSDSKAQKLNYSSNDSDSVVNKIFSYLMHSPRAVYHMYNPTINMAYYVGTLWS